MPDFTTVSVAQDGHVAILSLNRPTKLNSINDAMFKVNKNASLGRISRHVSCLLTVLAPHSQELPAAVEHIMTLDDVRVVGQFDGTARANAMAMRAGCTLLTHRRPPLPTHCSGDCPRGRQALLRRLGPGERVRYLSKLRRHVHHMLALSSQLTPVSSCGRRRFAG